MHAFIKFVTEDWWIAVPMFAMSFVGIFLVIWRILLNNNAKTQMNVFLPQFQEKLEKEGVDGALKFCRSRTDIIPSRLFLAGLEQCLQGKVTAGAGVAALGLLRPERVLGANDRVRVAICVTGTVKELNDSRLAFATTAVKETARQISRRFASEHLQFATCG